MTSLHFVGVQLSVGFQKNKGNDHGRLGRGYHGFFGAVFASTRLYWHRPEISFVLALPFMIFALIAIAATYVIRMPGYGISPSPEEERSILWSSIAEGIGLFLAANVTLNLHRSDLLTS